MSDMAPSLPRTSTMDLAYTLDLCMVISFLIEWYDEVTIRLARINPRTTAVMYATERTILLLALGYGVVYVDESGLGSLL